MGNQEEIIKPKVMKRYARDTYKILGAVGEGVGNEIKEYKGITLYEFPRHKLFYKVTGYQKIEDNEYAVVYSSRKGKVILLSLVLLILLCLGGFELWKLMSPETLGLDGSAQNYEPRKKIAKNQDETKIAIPAYDDIKMPEGDTTHISLWNPDGNPCYFQFTIVQRDTKEELFQTALVEPGKAVLDQKLSKQLSEGVYPIIIRIETYSLQDKSIKLNGGEVQTNLVVIQKKG